MSAHPRFGFAIEYVEDIEVAKRFYTEVIGLTVERQHPAFVQFEHFAIASDQPPGGTGETELYWLVDDAQAAFEGLPAEAAAGVHLREEPYGKVFGVTGPSERPCFVLELAPDRPSEPA